MLIYNNGFINPRPLNLSKKTLWSDERFISNKERESFKKRLIKDCLDKHEIPSGVVVDIIDGLMLTDAIKSNGACGGLEFNWYEWCIYVGSYQEEEKKIYYFHQEPAKTVFDYLQEKISNFERERDKETRELKDTKNAIMCQLKHDSLVKEVYKEVKTEAGFLDAYKSYSAKYPKSDIKKFLTENLLFECDLYNPNEIVRAIKSGTYKYKF